jgi:hypothetical protein
LLAKIIFFTENFYTIIKGKNVSLESFYTARIIPHMHVLHINCRNGLVLDSIQPAYGVGIVSPEHETFCAATRTTVQFVLSLTDIPTSTHFDYIIIAENKEQKHSVHHYLSRLTPYMHETTIIIAETYDHTATPAHTQKQAFEVIAEIFCMNIPRPLAYFSPIVTSCARSLAPIKKRYGKRCAILRPHHILSTEKSHPSVSIIVPCRNEKGNIEKTVVSCPVLGSATEIIFVEGHSTDGTYQEIERVAADYPHKNIIFARQTGSGKADAVYAGFARAQGDIVIILDADLTVDPHELKKFFDILASRKADVAIGCRLDSREAGSMPFLNYCANIFFGKMLSLILRKDIKDSLCGTKALWRRDALLIHKNRSFIGMRDPFGDFDILFGATRLHRTIANVPVVYRKRIYGTTNIRHFYEVWFLLHFCVKAFIRFTSR